MKKINGFRPLLKYDGPTPAATEIAVAVDADEVAIIDVTAAKMLLPMLAELVARGEVKR